MRKSREGRTFLQSLQRTAAGLPTVVRSCRWTCRCEVSAAAPRGGEDHRADHEESLLPPLKLEFPKEELSFLAG